MPGPEELGLTPRTREIMRRFKNRPSHAFGDIPVTKDQARAMLEKEMECLGLNDSKKNKKHPDVFDKEMSQNGGGD